MRITTSGMKAGSLFKFLWIGNSVGWLPVFLLCGAAAALGYGTLTFNDQPIHGPMAIPAAVLLWVLFAAFFSCFQWLLLSFGFWLYSRFGRLSLDFRDAFSNINV